MKLKPNLSSFELGGERALVIPDTPGNAMNGIVHGNVSASVIMDCLREETDEEKILTRLRERYEGDENEMREDIDAVLAVLRRAGVLEE